MVHSSARGFRGVKILWKKPCFPAGTGSNLGVLPRLKPCPPMNLVGFISRVDVGFPVEQWGCGDARTAVSAPHPARVLFWRTFSNVCFLEGLMTVSRRDFLATAVVGSLSVGLPGVASGAQDSAGPKSNSAGGKRPIMVCANNGFNYLDDAYTFLAGGGDTLDAARGVGRRGAQYQECFAGFESGDGPYRPRNAGRRGRGTICRGCRISAGEFAD